jgi:large subunit ribosomal protein L30
MAEDNKVVKKAAPKKVAAKKPVAKKAPAKKAAPKKAAPKKVAAKKKTVSVTLVKSFHGRLPTHRATVTGLGLKRINHTVVLQDTPEVRGMINKVAYLLKIEG